MSFIYCLHSQGFVWYIGRTKNPEKRLREHRSKASNKGCGANLIPPIYDWEMKVLEECSPENQKQRERYWFDSLNPLLNKQVPLRTNSEASAAWEAINRERHNKMSLALYYQKKAARSGPE